MPPPSSDNSERHMAQGSSSNPCGQSHAQCPLGSQGTGKHTGALTQEERWCSVTSQPWEPLQKPTLEDVTEGSKLSPSQDATPVSNQEMCWSGKTSKTDLEIKRHHVKCVHDKITCVRRTEDMQFFWGTSEQTKASQWSR